MYVCFRADYLRYVSVMTSIRTLMVIGRRTYHVCLIFTSRIDLYSL